MLDPTWTLLLGVPAIVALLVLAWRRTRALAARIREVREEMARNPQDPYLALAMLTEARKSGARKPGAKADTKTKKR
jgi:predicted DNA-binding protein